MKAKHICGAMALLLAGTALVGCGSSGAGGGSQASNGVASSTSGPEHSDTGSSQQTIKVPEKFASHWTVPVLANYPPYGFVDDSGKPAGFDVSFAKALAKALGVSDRLKIVSQSVANEIAGVSAGKYIYATALTASKAREKKFDMVSYVMDGYSFATTGRKIGSSKKDLCGLRIAVEQGDTTITALKKMSKAVCTSAGKSSISVSVYPDESSAIVALKSGRADALSRSLVALEFAATKTNLTVTGPKYNQSPACLVTAKGTGIAKIIHAGIEKMMKNGSYEKVLDQYNLGSVAIHSPQINPSPES